VWQRSLALFFLFFSSFHLWCGSQCGSAPHAPRSLAARLLRPPHSSPSFVSIAASLAVVCPPFPLTPEFAKSESMTQDVFFSFCHCQTVPVALALCQCHWQTACVTLLAPWGSPLLAQRSASLSPLLCPLTLSLTRIVVFFRGVKECSGSLPPRAPTPLLSLRASGVRLE
jgi:hypothetical protein